MTYNFDGKRIAPENLLGQTILEERSGFKGTVLATTHTYDSLGRLVSTSADYEPTVKFAGVLDSYDVDKCIKNCPPSTDLIGAVPYNISAMWQENRTYTIKGKGCK